MDEVKFFDQTLTEEQIAALAAEYAPAPVPVTGVTVSPETATVKVGEQTTLTAAVEPEDADDPSVSWSSDNEGVATVENGVVTGVAEGTATITATTTDGEHEDTASLQSIKRKKNLLISTTRILPLLRMWITGSWAVPTVKLAMKM